MQKIKKVISFMLIMTLLVSVLGVMPAGAFEVDGNDGITLTLASDAPSYAFGATQVIVKIKMTEASGNTVNMAAFKADIGWDPAKLTLNKAEIVYVDPEGVGSQQESLYFHSTKYMNPSWVNGTVGIVFGPFVDKQTDTPLQVDYTGADDETIVVLTFDIKNDATPGSTGVWFVENSMQAASGRLYPTSDDPSFKPALIDPSYKDASFILEEEGDDEVTWEVNVEDGWDEVVEDLKFSVCTFVNMMWTDSALDDELYEGAYEFVTGFTQGAPACYIDEMFIVEGGKFILYQQDGTEVTSETDEDIFISTGMMLEIQTTSGTTVKKVPVVVMGDVDGDGVFSTVDVTMAVRMFNGNKPVSGTPTAMTFDILDDPPCYAIAADFRGELEVGQGDVFISAMAISQMAVTYTNPTNYIIHYPFAD